VASENVLRTQIKMESFSGSCWAY